MKVFVTGGCGFLGSHICEMYRKKGDDVISFDNLTKHELNRTGYNTDAARNHVLGFLREIGVEVVNGDIRNKDDMAKVSSECDFIVHAAAQPAMTIALENPDLDLTTNVVGTFNVLEVARKLDAPVVVCSSIHVYGNQINYSLKEGKERFFHDPQAIDENYPILQGSITPLHASKRSAELYTRAFIDSYGLKAAVFRLTGMYGPRQFGSEDHGWVANFAIKTILGKPMVIFGTGKQVRDILYATDAASAVDAFYNIGGGVKNIISISECITLIEKFANKKAKIDIGPKRLGDLWYFVSDISKAEKELGWAPKVNNEQGIRELINWISANINIFKGNN
ncbi:MAG: NAD-dependent epimerase/dehydratase family protein [Candidatus Bathyarchaeia archaeon]